MKKIILVFSVLIIFAGSISAQKGVTSIPLHISLGVDFGHPLSSETSAISNFVIGGDVQAEYMLSQNISATASIGLDARLAKGGIVNTKDFAPLLAGFRYYVSNKFYISEQAGYSFAVTKGLDNAFTDVTGLGYKPSANTDVLLAYKGMFYKKGSASAATTGTSSNSFSTIDIRVAFTFGSN